MENFHPLIIHFPIALTLVAVALDIAALLLKKEDWHTAAKWNYLAATITALGALGTGLYAEDGIPTSGASHDLAETHKLLGIGFTILTTFLVLWRFLAKTSFPRRLGLVYICGIVTAAGLVAATGHWGGRLVYEHGIGTTYRFERELDQGGDDTLPQPKAALPAGGHDHQHHDAPDAGDVDGGAMERTPLSGPIEEVVEATKPRYKLLIEAGKCIVLPREKYDKNLSAVYKGETYYFCCQKCLQNFKANPEKYLK